jgi:hypothetical protein
MDDLSIKVGAEITSYPSSFSSPLSRCFRIFYNLKGMQETLQVFTGTGPTCLNCHFSTSPGVKGIIMVHEPFILIQECREMRFWIFILSLLQKMSGSETSD